MTNFRAAGLFFITLVLTGVPAGAQSYTGQVPNLSIPVPRDFTPPGANIQTNTPNLGIPAPKLGFPAPDLSIRGPGNLTPVTPDLGIRGPGNLSVMAPNLGIAAPDLSIRGPGDLVVHVPDLRIPAPDLSQPHPPGSYPYDYRLAWTDYYNREGQRAGITGSMGYGDYCVHYQPSLGNCRFNYVAPHQREQTNHFRPENNSQVYRRFNNFNYR